jgi:hypothetical protein
MKPKPTIADLQADYDAAVAAELQALKDSGDEFSRAVMNASFMKRNAERRLEAAKDAQARRDEIDKLTPAEIVARAYERQ